MKPVSGQTEAYQHPQEQLELFVQKAVDKVSSERSSPVHRVHFERLLQQEPRTTWNHWLKVFASQPDLFSLPFAKLQLLPGVLNTLTLGFRLSKAQSFSVLGSVSHEILLLPDFSHILSNWMSFCNMLDANPAQAINCLVACPSVLYYDGHVWVERLNQITDEYSLRKRNLKRWLLQVPWVFLLEPWETLSSRLNYLVKVMHTDLRDVSNNPKVLLSSLETIRKRYLFLERSGLYRHPTFNALGSTKSAFPLISDILLTEDQEFVTKVAGHGLTMHEFRLFEASLDFELETFAHPEERLWYAQVGYFDPHFREDLLQKDIFQKSYTD